ncbi:MAG: hypothetical protein AABY83_12500 [Pseudomonadota bacterium]
MTPVAAQSPAQAWAVEPHLYRRVQAPQQGAAAPPVGADVRAPQRTRNEALAQAVLLHMSTQMHLPLSGAGINWMEIE